MGLLKDLHFLPPSQNNMATCVLGNQNSLGKEKGVKVCVHGALSSHVFPLCSHVVPSVPRIVSRSAMIMTGIQFLLKINDQMTCPVLLILFLISIVLMQRYNKSKYPKVLMCRDTLPQGFIKYSFLICNIHTHL